MENPECKVQKKISKNGGLLKIRVTGVTVLPNLQNVGYESDSPVTLSVTPSVTTEKKCYRYRSEKNPVTHGNTPVTPSNTKRVTAQTHSGKEFPDLVTPVTPVTPKKQGGGKI